MFTILSGTLAQIFRPDAMPFQDHLTEIYGSIYRVSGYLGVCCLSKITIGSLTSILQEQVLVVSDLDALHHIVVKHVDIFDTADWFLE